MERLTKVEERQTKVEHRLTNVELEMKELKNQVQYNTNMLEELCKLNKMSKEQMDACRVQPK